MKTALFVTSMLMAIPAVSLAQVEAGPLTAEQQAIAKSIHGYYELKLDDGNIRRRFISDGRWMITQYDPKTNVVIFHHGGTYVFDGKNYVEHVEYANGNTKFLVGNDHRFIITVKPNSIHMEGVKNPWNEEWVRVKDDSFKKEVDPNLGTYDAD